MLPKVVQISVGLEDPQTKSYFDSRWASVTKALEECSELTKIESLEDIGSILEKINPSAFVVLAGSWNRPVLELISQTPTLKKYAENGGNVLYAGPFVALCDPRDIKRVFGEEGFNVDWSFGKFIGYEDRFYEVNGSLNRNAEVYTNNSLNLQSAQLPDKIDPFRPLLVNVKNLDHVLYEVVGYPHGGNHQAAGVMARVGKGHVGLWGDRDNDVAQTVDVIPAMLGITRKQQQ